MDLHIGTFLKCQFIKFTTSLPVGDLDLQNDAFLVRFSVRLHSPDHLYVSWCKPVLHPAGPFSTSDRAAERKHER